jgi:hypothetical protein
LDLLSSYAFTQSETTGNYSAIAIIRTFQFTVAHALGFSVFTSRLLTAGLSQSYCNFKSRMTSSGHSLIPFLPFLLSHLRLSSPELDAIPIVAALYSLDRTPVFIVKELVYSPVA